MDKIIEYIKQSRQQGLTDEQIQQSLITGGWTAEQVQSAFSAIAASSSLPRSKHNSRLILFLVIIVVFFLSVSAYVVWLYALSRPNPGRLIASPQPEQTSPLVNPANTLVFVQSSSAHIALFDFEKKQVSSLNQIFPDNQNNRHDHHPCVQHPQHTHRINYYRPH